MKICITSDWHGCFPIIPECDLLLIAGDIAPGFLFGGMNQQENWMESKFAEWIQQVPMTIATAGNHDEFATKSWLPRIDNFKLLIDETIEYKGLKIHGCPWSRKFCNWHFNASVSELTDIHAKIPKCDILLSHGPMFGCGDLTTGGERVGAKSLNEAVTRIGAKVVVTGHIHEDFGRWRFGEANVYNASYLNGEYEQSNEPILLEV